MSTAFAAVKPDASTIDEALLDRALAQANLNVLRMTLYQLTGDTTLRDMRVLTQDIRGGALYTFVLAPEHHDEVRARAKAWLLGDAQDVPPPPSSAMIEDMLRKFGCEPITDAELAFGKEELAFDQFPRDVHWTKRPSNETLANFNVVVIGAGIGGIAAAMQLQRVGIPYTVIERQDDIGGTWQLNTYPDARVDTSSYLYQFKFEKNYPWSEFFASQAETQKYLHHIATKYCVYDGMQFGREVVAAKWDEAKSVWRLTVNHKDGTVETIEANVVISASGLFSTPNRPDIPGIDTFEGRMFHTAEWEHDYDHAGKRVALIGNGSTGTQLMPKLAEAAGSFALYQRTPSWIMQMENYRAPVSDEARWLFDNMPYYWNWYCYSSHFTGQQLQGMQTYDHDWIAKGGKVNARNDRVRGNLIDYIRGKVGHIPGMVEKLVPNYAPLVRRLVVDNGFYDTLLRDNVELVTEGIERITPKGILTTDGVEREFDLIVLGSGFAANDYFFPIDYEGRGGATLSEAWKEDGARSYLGLAMADFPNLFTFYGPNGQPRSGGFYSWAEVWSRYAVKAIVRMIEKGASSIEVKRETFDDYNARMDEEMKTIIWEMEGTMGYYVNKHGRSGVNMPWTTHDYHAMVVEPDLGDYKLG